MNCQEITDLLDEGDVGRLTENERGEVEIHLSGCPDCAADWKIHQRLAAGFAPPMPAGLMERARALVAAGATANTRPASRRAILYGTLLAVAAAAALLSLWLNKSAEMHVAVESPEPPVVQPVAIAPVEAPPLAHVERQPAAPPPVLATVRVAPLKIEGDDASGDAMAQRFRELVIAKLRGVSGVAVVDPESADDVAQAQYEIRMTFQGVASLPMRAIMIDARTAASFAAVEVRIEAEAKMAPADQERSTMMRREEEVQTQLASMRRRLELSLLGTGVPQTEILQSPSPAPGITDEVDYAATTFVRDLRVNLLPPDASLERELLATLRDSAEKEGKRMRALGDLLAIADRRGGMQTADAAVVRAGAELALTYQEAHGREGIWKGLARAGNPELVPYLIRGLDTVSYTDTRLQIVKILATDFGGNPRAREALELASKQNQEPVVRMAALRETEDESKWIEYVVTTLNDTSLPDAQRLQPIADMAPTDRIAVATGTATSTFQLEDQSIRELAALIPRAARDNSSSGASRNAAKQALQVLGLMRGPVVLDSLIEIMNMPDTERPGMSKASVNKIKSDARTLIVHNFAADPKARAAVEAQLNDPASSLSVMPGQMDLLLMDARANQGRLKKQAESQPPQPSQ